MFDLSTEQEGAGNMRLRIIAALTLVPMVLGGCSGASVASFSGNPLMEGFQQSGAIELSGDYRFVFESSGLCEYPDDRTALEKEYNIGFTLTPTPNVRLETIDSSNETKSFYMQLNGTFQQGYLYGLPYERYQLVVVAPAGCSWSLDLERI